MRYASQVDVPFEHVGVALVPIPERVRTPREAVVYQAPERERVHRPRLFPVE